MRQAGTRVDHWQSVTNTLRELIEALPECAPKAALRGMAAACVAAGEGEVPADTLDRMTNIVRAWRESDPLVRLEAELDHLAGTRGR
jgi:hypothetical protein